MGERDRGGRGAPDANCGASLKLRLTPWLGGCLNRTSSRGEVTRRVDLFPDLATTDDDELERLLRAAEDEGDAISARRRALHLRIDSLREERVSRLRGQVEAGTLEVSTPATFERPIFEGTGTLPDDHDDPEPDLAATAHAARPHRHPPRGAGASPPWAARRARRARADPRS